MASDDVEMSEKRKQSLHKIVFLAIIEQFVASRLRP